MDKGKRKVLAFLMAILMAIFFAAGPVYAVAPPKSADFNDLSKTAWYYDYVMCLADRGVVQGYGNTGEFRPTNLVTREHAAKMIALAAELNYADKKADFPDVDAEGEFSPYIAALVEKGEIQGFPDGSFKPQDKIKRSHVAKIIQAAFGLELSAEEVDITDLTSQDAGLAEAIRILASNYVVKGFGHSNLFKPDDDITRAELAKMLCIAIAVSAVQKAEALATPDAISQAQAQVDRIADTQDTKSNAFLQNRLDALQGSASPDPGEPGPVSVDSVELQYKDDSFIVLEENNEDDSPTTTQKVYVMKEPTLKLSEKIMPLNASNKNVSWSSSNNAIATVDGDGQVTAHSKGKVTITVKTEDGGKEASIEFIVPIFVGDVTRLTEVINGNGAGAADDGDYVLLATGKYALTETLIINKSITLLGPQAGVDPRPSQNSARALEDDNGVLFNDADEAILTGNKGTVEDYSPPNGGGDHMWLKNLVQIKAHNVMINGLTMEQTYNSIVESLKHSSEQIRLKNLRILNNIVRYGRGNEGIDISNTTNALVQGNYIYDISYPGDAIEAYGVEGCMILDNEINDCNSGKGAIHLLNKKDKDPVIVKGNLIKATRYHFAIFVEGDSYYTEGFGDIRIEDNDIVNAGTGGIFVYKYLSASGAGTQVEIINNRITNYATAPPSGSNYVETYLRESASAIAVSFNLSAGNQPKIVITDNTTSGGGAEKPVLAFGGGSPNPPEIPTDLSLITVKNNTFDQAELVGIKLFEGKTQESLITDGNSWGQP